MESKYRKQNTFLVRINESNDFMRWESDKKLFFAGSQEDALEGLNPKLFEAIPVCEAPLDIQKEYEELIDNSDD